MRTVYSYVRLALASWMFLGGVALQFLPSAAAVERDVRRRERQLQAVPVEERADWLRTRDLEDGRSEAYLRLFGVLLGGVGFGIALHEVAYIGAQYGRRCPFDAP
jgi:hypothetical protein